MPSSEDIIHYAIIATVAKLLWAVLTSIYYNALKQVKSERDKIIRSHVLNGHGIRFRKCQLDHCAKLQKSDLPEPDFAG